MNLRQELERRISVALSAAGAADAPAMVAPTDPKFGDYKASGVMGAAKRLKLNPRELAARVVALLQKGGANDLSDLAEKIEIAGPGFINITLRKEWLQDRLADLRSDDKLGVTVALAGEVGSSAALASGSRLNVVVDYSAPNLAKEMHVGHLRSTIIGDALARVLEFQGHNVIRQNHVGDWGTQFGMVILGIWQIAMAEHHGELQYIAQTREKLKPLKKDSSLSDRKTALEPIVRRQQDDVFADWDGEKVFHPFILRMIEEKRPLSELLPAYKLVNRCEELAEGTDLTIVTSPNSEVVPFASLSSYVASMLQDFADTRSQNVQEREAWKYARQATIEECQKIYDRMGIQLTELDVRGESYYGGIDQQALVYDADRDMLPSVVSELTAKGLLTASQGAMCVFMPQFMAKDGSPLPLIVQKSNEGYLYATTDLAAICFRIRELKVDRILYVVDKRQSLHFQMVFATTRTAGFAPDNVSLEHVAFGTMMGADGKPFRTRDGETVKLMDLLDEAV
jgi:arginyl-tRNA synthetase